MFILKLNFDGTTSSVVTLTTKLSQVRSRLVFTKFSINNLESDLIHFYMCPHRTLLNNKNNKNHTDKTKNEEPTIIQVDVGQISGDLSSAWDIRKCLLSDEYFIIEDIKTANKEKDKKHDKNKHIIPKDYVYLPYTSSDISCP